MPISFQEKENSFSLIEHITDVFAMLSKGKIEN